MFQSTTLQQILDSRGVDTLATLVAVYTINVTTKVKAKDLTCAGSYTKRVVKRISTHLQCSHEEAEKWLNLSLAVDEYETRQAMAGIGGCTPITIEEALARREQ